MGSSNLSDWGSNVQQGQGSGSKKGHGQAVTAPAVSQPPVSQAPAQQLTSLEQQYVDAPWSEPSWQSNINPTAQGLQSQYLDAGSTASEQSGSSDMLTQWLFGGVSSTGG